jgi:hypothetical protein
MRKFSTRIGATLLALATFVLVATLPDASRAQQAPAVDPEAVKILKRTMDYLGSLQQFSVGGGIVARRPLSHDGSMSKYKRRTCFMKKGHPYTN